MSIVFDHAIKSHYAVITCHKIHLLNPYGLNKRRQMIKIMNGGTIFIFEDIQSINSKYWGAHIDSEPLKILYFFLIFSKMAEYGNQGWKTRLCINQSYQEFGRL